MGRGTDLLGEDSKKKPAPVGFEILINFHSRSATTLLKSIRSLFMPGSASAE
jgi:hypothetical protein